MRNLIFALLFSDKQDNMEQGPIGIFDSGYGGLTIFREIKNALPAYDYIYLGDNARVPYGPRSFETVYTYTKECVFELFEMGCNLVVIACNTASAKALRTIQQRDLPPGKKVLGVIRPTTETLNNFTQSGEIGILATLGTVRSDSYKIEINKFHPHVQVYQHACPLWVPLVENNEINTPEAEYIIAQDLRELLSKSANIDALVLACTHYPLLSPVIERYVPNHVRIVAQGPLIASSLTNYLYRHTEIERLCSKNGTMRFFTTDNQRDFQEKAALYFGEEIEASYLKM
ncbi:MAG: glutamate racemase [Sphingobacterium sp.]|nr:glutamate racemase [Sphingobacterium sp. JB170]SJN39561.1 Glutamate racemase [Sphingobacterium sp. JB170]